MSFVQLMVDYLGWLRFPLQYMPLCNAIWGVSSADGYQHML